MKTGMGNQWIGEFVPCLAQASLKPSCSQKRDLQSNQNDLRTQFYEHYRKEADDYDREFMKKYDEDLNTTLIFVRRGSRLVERADLGHRPAYFLQ